MIWNLKLTLEVLARSSMHDQEFCKKFVQDLARTKLIHGKVSNFNELSYLIKKKKEQTSYDIIASIWVSLTYFSNFIICKAFIITFLIHVYAIVILIC